MLSDWGYGLQDFGSFPDDDEPLPGPDDYPDIYPDDADDAPRPIADDEIPF